jgi:hypothetical protein
MKQLFSIPSFFFARGQQPTLTSNNTDISPSFISRFAIRSETRVSDNNNNSVNDLEAPKKGNAQYGFCDLWHTHGAENGVLCD